MKIRMGFVTNSSSYSSTILTLKSEKLDNWLEKYLYMDEPINRCIYRIEGGLEYSKDENGHNFGRTRRDIIENFLDYFADEIPSSLFKKHLKDSEIADAVIELGSQIFRNEVNSSLVYLYKYFVDQFWGESWGEYSGIFHELYP